jgi:acyl dehydratase
MDAKITRQYFEDYLVGQVFNSGRLRVDREAIVAFAREFDPQPYHLDEEAARNSIFGELVASGWHTAALTMRLLVESEFRPAGGILGIGLDELSWPRPVRPGDELHVTTEVLDVQPSKSRSDRGMIRVRNTTFNHNDEAVQIFIPKIIVPRRPAVGSM